MATNNGNNGSNGIIRGTSETPKKGLGAAFEQANYRREYGQKMFSKDGYLDSSIKELNNQSKAMSKMMKESSNLTKAEQKRYKETINNMKKLAAEQKKLLDNQEASSKELKDTLDKSAKLRLKAVDDMYKQFMSNEEALKNMSGAMLEAKRAYFADQTAEIKAVAADIDAAAKKFEESKKSFKDGWNETVSSFAKASRDFSKVLNLQNIASNQWLDKVNEKYDVINKLNQTLGYGLTENSKTYTSIFGAFKEFNENVNGLFNTDDLRQYFDNSSKAGVHNRQMLQDNLESSLIAQKYLGASNDTMTSMYKYMKLTNNNDTINKYNKTMIALAKSGNSIAEDTLSQMIQDNMDLSESLFAAGMDPAVLEKYNQERNIIGAQVATKFNDDNMAKDLNSLVNKVTNLAMDYNTVDQVEQMGVDSQKLIRETQAGNTSAAYETIISGLVNRSNDWGGDVAAMTTFFKQLGIDSKYITLAKTIGSGTISGFGEATEEIKKKADEMTNQDVTDYVDQNVAISDIQRDANKMSTQLDDLIQNNETIVKLIEGLSKVVFWTSVIGTGLQAVNGLISGISSIKDMVGAFKEGGFLSKIFGKFLGKGSTIAGGAEQMSLFTKGQGAAASSIASTAATVASGVALGVGAAAVITKGIDKARENARNGFSQKSQDSADKYDSIMGTELNNDTHTDLSNSAYEVSGDNNNFFTQFGGAWQTTTGGMWAGLNNWHTSDVNKINEREYYLFNARIKQLGYDKDRAESMFLTWALLADSAGFLKSAGNGSYTRENLNKILSSGKWNYNKDLLDYYAGVIVNDWKKGPYKNKKDRQSSINWDLYNITEPNLSQNTEDGYHKAGLNKVPKDNYRALLHKGEMVLNEEDANHYRTLMGGKNVPLLESNSKRGIGGKLGGKEIGDFNSSYINGHSGVDLYFSTIGTPVGSATAGTVLESKDIQANFSDGKSYHGKDSTGKAYSSYGRVVKVKGNDGETYIYAHLNERAVKAGDRVDAGTLLGYSGTTGNSSGPHLHFEVSGKGNTSAAHARYYTDYIRSASGASASSGPSDTSSSSSSDSGSSGKKLELAKQITSSKRLIPGIGGDENPPDGISPVDRIVGSVDGVSTKIIKYLDEIRSEQEDQRRLINAFSASQQTIN